MYHEDEANHPISKLSEIWDEGFLQERIFGELRRLARFGRSLEEAARYKFQRIVQHSHFFLQGPLHSRVCKMQVWE